MELTLEEGGNIRGILENTGVLTEEMGLQPKATQMSNLKLLGSVKLENHLLIIFLTGILTEKNHYDPLLSEIDTILSLIDDSIK